MLLDFFFEPEKFAYKLKGWRGPVQMLVGLGFCLVGYLVAQLFLLVSSFGKVQPPLEGVPLWMFLAIEAVAFLTMLSGAWLWYQDSTYQAWRETAEKHRSTRW
ncbi:MAG: hypothetical protein RSB86_17220 [Comamonas sp.]|uniref:hypothetical protein n=1 Tax=Comamonas sp. TaxID=34028 RepID=UPI002FCA3999